MIKCNVLILTLAVAGSAALADGKPDLSRLDLSKLPAPASKPGITYATDIHPMLEASCLRCHGQERPKAGLRLDSLEAALKGSREGKVIIPGDSKQSLLVVAASRIDEETAMPPKRKPGRGGPGGPGGAGHPPAGPDGGNPQSPRPAGQGGPGGPGGFGPPPKPLTAEQVGVLRAWIDQGAK